MPTILPSNEILLAFSQKEARAVFEFFCALPKEQVTEEIASLAFALQVALDGTNMTGKID